MAVPSLLPGVRDLAGDYDAFILDLWGVLHDGTAVFPRAVAALDDLRSRGKRICLLSNAPRRAAAVREQIAGFGLAPARYDTIYTSGEAAFELLRDRPDSFMQRLGRKLLHLGPERDRSCFDGLAYEAVDSPEAADFVLNTGPIDRLDPVDKYETLLERARTAGLPMICANPDRVVHVGAHLVTCAGALAQRYAERGGTVRWLGKPYPEIYERALALLGNPSPSRVAAIGDSLLTDIAGGQQAGLAAYLVPGGIHRDELGDRPTDAEALAGLYRRYNVIPTGVLPELAW